MDWTKINLIKNNLSKEEVYLVNNKSDILYLTGEELDGVSLIISHIGEIFFLTPKMLLSQTKKFFNKNKILDDKNFISEDSLVLQLKKLPLKFKKIIVQKNVSLSLYKMLSKNWYIEPKDLISVLRQKKSKQEIVSIKKAVIVTKKVLSETRKILNLGVTEKEVKKFILKKFLDYDVEPSFDPIVAFDENTSFPHHISSNKSFNDKSFVLIDLGCKVDGYCSDITRMFFVNNNRLVSYYYKKLCELQKKLISMCIIGMKVAKIDIFAKKFCENIGIEKNYLHSTGHGVGIDVHEIPRISVNDKTILSEGMVITIEPGIYFSKECGINKNFGIETIETNQTFGLRVEDMILVTKSGPKILTK